MFNNGATGRAQGEPEVLHRIRPGRVEARQPRDVELRSALRVLHAAPGSGRHRRIFDINTGMLKPQGTPFYESKKNNFQPRVGMTWAPGDGSTVLRGGFGIFVGPGQTEDQIQPIESDRISTTITGGSFLSIRRCCARTSSATRTTALTSRARTPTSTRFPSGSTSTRPRCSGSCREARRDGRLRRQPGPQPLPAQLREPHHRGAHQRRTRRRTRSSSGEFDIVRRQHPASVCRDRLQDQRRARQLQRDAVVAGAPLQQRPDAELAIHARPKLRQHGRVERSADRRQQRRVDDFDYDIGYNAFDVRHTFNVSALYTLPIGGGHRILGNASGLTQALLGGWDVGAIVNARSGLPIDVRVTRPGRRLHGRGGEYLRQPGGSAERDHQHAGRRLVAQRAAAEPGPGCRSRI